MQAFLMSYIVIIQNDDLIKDGYMKEKQLPILFMFIFNLLLLAGCGLEKKENLTQIEIEKIQSLINEDIKEIPTLKWDFVGSNLTMAVNFTSVEQQNIDMETLERVVLKAVHQVLGPIPTDITIVSKPKVEEVIDRCPGSNKVLPVRLFINKENKIFSYGSEITEPYLESQFKSLPYGGDSARITFLYEKGASLEYMKKIHNLLKYSGHHPILLEKPTDDAIWNWQNSSNKVKVSSTYVEL